MQCYTPITIFKKEKRRNQEYHSDVFPCGKCPACLRRRQAAWVFRLEQEQQRATSSAFLTLTYDEQNLPWSVGGYPTLNTRDHQSFMKRLRTTIQRKFKSHVAKIKYYSVGEYGGDTHRPHMHSIMFNLPNDYLRHPELLEREWQKGAVDVGTVTVGSIAYVTGYMSKTLYTTGQDEADDRKKEFSLQSNGIGENYLTHARVGYYKKILTPYLIKEDGEKATMPRYYKDKLYTESQKSKINEKTKLYLEENPIFLSEKQRQDFIEDEFRKQKRRDIVNRHKI